MKKEHVLWIVVASLAIWLLACTATLEPTVSPLPTPTPDVSPLPPIDFVPMPDVVPTFKSASRAMVNLAVLQSIEATTHFHQLRIDRQLRRVDDGEVLFEASAMTGIVGTDYVPEPGIEFAAAWTYDIDLEVEYGVKEAKEYVRAMWVCVRELGEIGACMCQMNPGDELMDCTEIVGRCESKDGSPQDADGFCFTDYFTDLLPLRKQWLPIVFVEKEE